MALPNPKNKEKKSEFVSRCIGDTQSNKDFPDQKQRIAVCYSQWDKAKKDAQVVAGEGMNEFLYSAQKTYNGQKRSELKDSDFLFPQTRSFPIVTPQDVKDAISNYGRMGGNMSYDEFIKKLYNKAKSKGKDFMDAIPESTKKEHKLTASEINIEIDIDNGVEDSDEEECDYCCDDCSYEWSGEECDVKCCPKCGSTNCSEMNNEDNMTQPMSENEMQNGEAETVNATEDYNNLEMLAVQFRSAQLYTHNAHHLTKGPTFFADHEFLGELYESYTEAYDQLIEIILSDSVKPNLVNIQIASASKLSEIQGENYFNTLIDLELAVQSKVELLAAETGISQGVLNLIAGFAQDSKSRVYKLRARVA